MRQIIAYKKGSLTVNKSFPGQSIEQRVEKILHSREPITDGAPRIYTERKDGVLPQYDIRTDRWEIAVEAMDAITGSHKAKREERIKSMGEKAQDGMRKEGETTSGKGGVSGGNGGGSDGSGT